MAQEVFILGGKRTPMGEYVGALKDISAIDLGATASKAALETTGVAAEEIDHAIFGNALQTSGDAIYGARHVALKAGVPFDRPALTVNRLVRQRHSIDRVGRADDSTGRSANMSGRRHGVDVSGAACDSRGAFRLSVGSGKTGRQLDGGAARHVLQYADGRHGGKPRPQVRDFTEEQDEYALRSQQAAKRAIDEGFFADEIAPVEVKSAERDNAI